MTDNARGLLDDLELDALTELVNLGVSRAAASLREMIGGEQVHLSVPSVLLVGRTRAIEILSKSEPGKLVAVHQMFEGPIYGRALLIFPEVKSLELVRAVTSVALSIDDIIDLEHEALAETGNVILNSCLATMANQLRRTLKISLPEIFRGDGQTLFGTETSPQASDAVVFVYINFTVRRGDIQGYIAMLMDMLSLTALKGLLDEYIQRTIDGSEPSSDAPA